MSTTQVDYPVALPLECPIIDGCREIQRIDARHSDVGGIPVARLIPARKRRLIGAWCFLDHMGPVEFDAGTRGLQVGPHPHIGLQTFTWLIAGEVLHLDSLGYEQRIRPGQVNLMTAGAGISHAEESIGDARQLHGVQLWVALPFAHRHTAPRFDHHPDLPRFSQGEMEATVLVGNHDGHESPVPTFSPLIGLNLAWSGAATQSLALRPDFEYGILPLEGGVRIDGEHFDANQLAYLGINRSEVNLETDGRGSAIVVGGEPLSEDIVIWWNFVGHTKPEIERAQQDWLEGSPRFGTVRDASGSRLEPPPIPWQSRD